MSKMIRIRVLVESNTPFTWFTILSFIINRFKIQRRHCRNNYIKSQFLVCVQQSRDFCVLQCISSILGFRCLAIKTKNRNYWMNKVKNLREWRGHTCTHSFKILGLCGSLRGRYSAKCCTQIYRALYGDAMLVSLRGAQTWRPEKDKI